LQTLIYRLKFCTEKEGRGNFVRFVAGAKGFSLLQNIQTACGVHPASYSLGIAASFPAVKQPSLNLPTHLHFFHVPVWCP